jgi:hypothetical protein
VKKAIKDTDLDLTRDISVMNLFESVLLESPRGADNGDKAEERKASDLI